MNKKGFFFFLEWGKDHKQETISGIKLGIKCNCNNKTFNLIYNLQRSHIFWVIPVSGWEIVNTFMQCNKCGAFYKLEGKQEEQAIKLHENVSEKREETNEEYLEEEKTIQKPKTPKKAKSKWFNNFKDDVKSLRH